MNPGAGAVAVQRFDHQCSQGERLKPRIVLLDGLGQIDGLERYCKRFNRKQFFGSDPAIPTCKYNRWGDSRHTVPTGDSSCQLRDY